jgi:CubicO group peptidase (beta-lactamase class C family)
MPSRSTISRRAFLGASAASLATVCAGLAPGRAESAKIAAKELSDMRETMEKHVAEGTMAGAVWAVHHGGETHFGHAGTFEMGAGKPMTRDTIFRVASITKPVTAATAMRLVERGVLTLDGPVDGLLPELANPRVLKSVDAELDDTVPAERPVTLRHLLTQTFGLGAIMEFPEKYPIQTAMREAGIAPGPQLPSMTPDEYMRRLGELPLAYQPGEQFLYNNGLDVAGILISRATGKPLSEAMDELVFAPLGMQDTGFHVPEDKVDRLPAMYFRNPQDGELVTMAEAGGGSGATPPVFESGAGGLVTTIDDYLAFARMMLNDGERDGVRLLEPGTVAEMTRNQLTDEQRAHSDATWFMFDGHGGWGLGMSVGLTEDKPLVTPGRFGWDGGYGTSAYVDPENDLIGLFFSQQMMSSPEAPKTYVDFWRHAYGAIGG